jgi:hypothetical protein
MKNVQFTGIVLFFLISNFTLGSILITLNIENKFFEIHECNNAIFNELWILSSGNFPIDSRKLIDELQFFYFSIYVKWIWKVCRIVAWNRDWIASSKEIAISRNCVEKNRELSETEK